MLLQGQGIYLQRASFRKSHPGKVAANMYRTKQQLISQHFGQDKAKCAYLEVACDHLVHSHVEEVTYGTCAWPKMCLRTLQRLEYVASRDLPGTSEAIWYGKHVCTKPVSTRCYLVNLEIYSVSRCSESPITVAPYAAVERVCILSWFCKWNEKH